MPERLRPESIEELIGQKKVLEQVQRYIRSGFLPNLIFYGPPGTGKTTLAKILSQHFEAEFISINAVESGAKDLKSIGDEARLRRLQYQKRSLLFVDEIHRFNKAQQDVLLPFIEKGEMTLIGATTENPSYELNRALLSRCRVLSFSRLKGEDFKSLLGRALQKYQLPADFMNSEVLGALSDWSDGDARRFLTALEEILSDAQSAQSQGAVIELDAQRVQDILGQIWIGYDKRGDQHYDLASAFIKSMRGSDPDAALYYLARMIQGGEDINFIARRMVIFASEDIGNADPRALQVAVACAQAVDMVGLPEGGINLAHGVCYLASAPKSNRAYKALRAAESFVQKQGTCAVPNYLKSQPVPIGEAYKYPHDFPRSYVSQNYWPPELVPQKFYEPSERGFEKQITDFLNWLRGDSKS